MIPEPKYRDYFLSGDIDADKVKPVITFILDINYFDDLQEEDYKGYERKPIRLFINSGGGSTFDGYALVDIINQSKTPVYTIAIGHAMSMGLEIYLAGHKRFIGENATLMWHDVSWGGWDKTPGLQETTDEALRLSEMGIKSMTQKTMVTEEKLRDYISRKADWYIHPDEAIKLHIANEYYK